MYLNFTFYNTNHLNFHSLREHKVYKLENIPIAACYITAQEEK